jgi:hypothetical protein
VIVLDEQLLGRNLEKLIGAWYPGAVRFITELRAGTVIKDDAIPSILRQERDATFVTINESDFWEVVDITPDFCVVCFALPDSQVSLVPDLLRQVLNLGWLSTKALRMGCVIRVSVNTFSFYTSSQRTPQSL